MMGDLPIRESYVMSADSNMMGTSVDEITYIPHTNLLKREGLEIH